jgi:hypothetical protein
MITGLAAVSQCLVASLIIGLRRALAHVAA